MKVRVDEWQSNAYSQPAREWDKIQKARNTLEAYRVTDDASEQWSRNAQEEPHYESERLEVAALRVSRKVQIDLKAYAQERC